AATPRRPGRASGERSIRMNRDRNYNSVRSAAAGGGLRDAVGSDCQRASGARAPHPYHRAPAPPPPGDPARDPGGGGKGGREGPAHARTIAHPIRLVRGGDGDVTVGGEGADPAGSRRRRPGRGEIDPRPGRSVAIAADHLATGLGAEGRPRVEADAVL